MKTVQELLENYGMNYTVGKEKLLLASDQVETPFYATVREDNRAVFGTCKDVYTPFQNEELMEVAIRIEEETGYNLDSAKSFGAGEKVQALLRTKEEVLEYAEKGDILRKGIAITNSHDGTGSLRLALQTELLSCTNGMTRWMEGSKTSIRHSKNIKNMLEQALRGMDIIREEDARMMDDISRMNGTAVTASAINEIMQEIVGVDMRKVNQQWESEEYSTKRVNIAKSLFDSIDEEMQYKGSTMWGLLNGVTHYTTHKAGRDGSRELSKVFGSLMTKDRKAYEMILELV